MNRYGKRTRIAFERNGESVEHAKLLAKHLEELLQALCVLTGVDPGMSSWPQQGEVEVDGICLSVTVDQTRGHEAAVISIPPRQSSTPPKAAVRRKRFWG